MERYEELMQRVCAYVESKLKKTALREDEVWYSEYDINIVLDSDLIDDFTYTVTPQQLEYCIKDSNGSILEIGNAVLNKLHRHIEETFFKYD